jgi:hypothetical protein
MNIMATRHPAIKPVWREVESSSVARVGWCAEGMIVQFTSGTQYLYRGVSRQRAVAMVYAKSVGRYLNDRVKPSFEALKLS